MASIIWAVTVLATLAAAAPVDASLPIVDLGYVSALFHISDNIVWVFKRLTCLPGTSSGYQS